MKYDKHDFKTLNYYRNAFIIIQIQFKCKQHQQHTVKCDRNHRNVKKINEKTTQSENAHHNIIILLS